MSVTLERSRGQLALLTLLVATTVTSCDSTPKHWGYGIEGGPEQWGSMEPAFALCSTGLSQSPIDIITAQVDDIDLEALRFAYGGTPLDIENNGHTIQVNVSSDATLSIGESRFKLAQFHFHGPSEHKIDGIHAPLEMHLVHHDDAGLLAVVGVLIEAGDANPELAKAWTHMPTEAGTSQTPAGVKIDLPGLLPGSTEGYHYQGSLTTPPCTEGVRWVVLMEPIQASPAQIDAFGAVVPPNNRPTQMLNGRTVTR